MPRRRHHRNDGLDLDGLRDFSYELAEAAGVRVRERRKALDLTQEQLADLCQTTTQTISKIELGEITPRDYLKAAIAIRLSMEVGEIWPAPALVDIAKAAS